jgi:hypothetical protein
LKKQNKSFTDQNVNEVAKILVDYVEKAKVVKSCVARNRGGKKEATYNESEVGSAANTAIYKVITKVTEYRQERTENPALPVKRQFEDVPLLIKYFDKTFVNLLKDMASGADAQKRSRRKEILHTFETSGADELHGNWDEVNARDRKDIIDQAISNLRKALVHEQSQVTEMLVRGFELLFVERVTSDDEFAKDMALTEDQATSVKARIMRLISDYCREEMSELFNIARNNKTQWEIGRDEAKAANKASVAEKVVDEMDLKVTDLSCEVTTIVHSKKVNDKVQLTISVQILRETGVAKEVVQTVQQFSAECESFPSAMETKAKLQAEVKIAEQCARAICADRRRKATELFGESAA